MIHTHHSQALSKYYSRKDHLLWYQQLKEVMDKFTHPELLLETVHTMSTQKNEAMNHSIASFAPKFYHFSGTPTLETRVQVAIGCNNMGTSAFYNSVICSLTKETEPNETIPNFHRISKKKKSDKIRHQLINTKLKRRHKSRSNVSKILTKKEEF